MSDKFSLNDWAKMPETYFDETEYFEAEVKPVLENLKTLCNARGLGLFAAVDVANAEKTKTTFISSCMTPERVMPEHLGAIALHEAKTMLEAAHQVARVAAAYSKKISK